MSAINPQPITENEIENLFFQYLNVCNQAMALHQTDMPFREMLMAEQADLHSRPFDLAIYDDRPKGAFSLQLKNEQLVPQGDPENVIAAWRLNITDLQHVVDHSAHYIQHPEQLHLDWLKSRFGF